MVFSKENKQLVVKLILVIIVFLFWLLYRLVILASDEKGLISRYCFKDLVVLDFLSGFTRLLAYDLQYRDYILIFSSNVLDILFLFVLIHYIVYGNSSRLVIALSTFYPLRTVIQLLFLLEMYDISLFDFPGFYSIVVPLHPGVDFFFSGHVGSCTILMLYFRDHFPEKIFFYSSIVLTIIEGLVMMTLRGHYFIDIVFGILIAHYLYIWAETFSNLLDSKFPIFGTKRSHSEVNDIRSLTKVSVLIPDKNATTNS